MPEEFEGHFTKSFTVGASSGLDVHCYGIENHTKKTHDQLCAAGFFVFFAEDSSTGIGRILNLGESSASFKLSTNKDSKKLMIYSGSQIKVPVWFP